MSQQRAPVEAFYPKYVDADDVEFDYCYATCGCGWRSEDESHPYDADHELDLHHDYSRTPDCTLGETHLIFADGTEATIQ